VDVLLGPPPGCADFADFADGERRFTSARAAASAPAALAPAAHSTFLPRLLASLRRAGVLTDDLSGPADRTPRGHCASYMGVGLAPPRPAAEALASAAAPDRAGPSFEPGVYRRIDLKAYPRAAFPFALFYFTGSGATTLCSCIFAQCFVCCCTHNEARARAFTVHRVLPCVCCFTLPPSPHARVLRTGHFNRSVRLWAKRHGWTLTDTGLWPRHDPGGGGRVVLRSEADIFAALGLEYRSPAERNVDGAAAAGVDTAGGAGRGDSLARQGLTANEIAAADAAHRAQKKYG
jgi:hypothetical protein